MTMSFPRLPLNSVNDENIRSIRDEIQLQETPFRFIFVTYTTGLRGAFMTISKKLPSVYLSASFYHDCTRQKIRLAQQLVLRGRTI